MRNLWLILILFAATTEASQLPTGVITGQLRGADGTPAAGVRIAAEEIETKTEQRNLVSIGRTDDAGRYRLEAVPPGRYWIVAGSLTAPTYYPGVEDATTARPVAVTAGATVAGMDFAIVAALNSMTNETTGRGGVNNRRPEIKGRFLIEGGGELPSPFGDFHVWYEGTAPIIQEDGTFSLSLSPKAEFVTVAIYSNKLIGDYYIKSMTYGSLDLLKNPLVIKGTASGIEIILARGSHVSGTITSEAGVPVEMTVFLIPSVRLPERPDLLRLANSDAQGHFEVFGVAPVEYRVSSANDNDSTRESPVFTVSGDPLDLRLILGPERGLHRVP